MSIITQIDPVFLSVTPKAPEAEKKKQTAQNKDINWSWEFNVLAH